MTNRRMEIWGWAAALLLCVSLSACDKSGGGKDDKGVPTAKSGAEQPAAEKATPTATSSTEKAAKPRKSLLEDPSEALDAIKSKIGGDKAMVLELLIFPTHIKVQVQDQSKKEKIDEFQWKDGSVQGPTPVQLTGSVAEPATLNKSVFDLSEADMGAVAKMAKDAVERLGLEGGKVTHVMLQRHLRLANQVQFRVYVSGTRVHASVAYDTKGTFKKIWK